MNMSTITDIIMYVALPVILILGVYGYAKRKKEVDAQDKE